jgi:type IV pilus biogenesis protein CpaD/CtpE
MRRIGRPLVELVLSAEERETLENWARRPKTAQAMALRARLIPGCAAGKTNTVVARELRVTKQTVGKWRSRFVTKRLDGLLDEPRPGAPRTVTDTAVERVVTLTLRSSPVMRRTGVPARWRGSVV